jgi:ubiquitin-protein ligase
MTPEAVDAFFLSLVREDGGVRRGWGHPIERVPDQRVILHHVRTLRIVETSVQLFPLHPPQLPQSAGRPDARPPLPRDVPMHVILLDTSGTMWTVCPALGKRKIELSRDFGNAFRDGLGRFAPGEIYGAMSLQEALAEPTLRLCPFIPPMPIPKRDEMPANTPLWAALNQIVRKSKAVPSVTHRRILLITDGENSPIEGGDTEQCYNTCKALHEAGFVVDVLLLPNDDRDNPDDEDVDAQRALYPLCRWTNGFLISANHIKNDNAILELLKSEQFCNLSLIRKKPPIQTPMGPSKVKVIRDLQGFVGNKRLPVSLRYKQKCPFFPLGGLPDVVSFRTERIRVGLEKCMRFFKIFHVKEDSFDTLRVFLPGPLNATEPTRVFWDLIVEFPADYPYVPPVLRFLCRPNLQEKDVSDLGRVNLSTCLSYQKVGIYHPCMDLFELLGRLYLFMENPRNWKSGGGKTTLDLLERPDGKARPLLELDEILETENAGSSALPKAIPQDSLRFPIAYDQYTWESITTDEGWTRYKANSSDNPGNDPPSVLE